MQIALPGGGLDAYKSKSQRARVATESWAESNLFCPNCSSPELVSAAIGTPVIDFTCPKCAATYQLKSQSLALSGRIVDAAYSSMVRAIIEDRTPNLYALHYHLSEWSVANVILIPRFAFPLSAIEETKTVSRDSPPRRMGRLQHPSSRNSGRRKNQNRLRRKASRARSRPRPIRPRPPASQNQSQATRLDPRRPQCCPLNEEIRVRLRIFTNTTPCSLSSTQPIATCATKSVNSFKSSATSASLNFWAAASTAYADRRWY